MPRKKEAVTINLNKNDGFSLLEIIISIAILSFISVFILQMFITSSHLNSRAKDVDKALACAISEIENFKKQTSASGYTEQNENGEILEDNGVTTVNFFYDENWNKLNASSGDASGKHYNLRLIISLEGSFSVSSNEDVPYGSIYSVKADVSDISLEADKQALVSLQSKKYFAKNSDERA